MMLMLEMASWGVYRLEHDLLRELVIFFPTWSASGEPLWSRRVYTPRVRAGVDAGRYDMGSAIIMCNSRDQQKPSQVDGFSGSVEILDGSFVMMLDLFSWVEPPKSAWWLVEMERNSSVGSVPMIARRSSTYEVPMTETPISASAQRPQPHSWRMPAVGGEGVVDLWARARARQRLVGYVILNVVHSGHVQLVRSREVGEGESW